MIRKVMNSKLYLRYKFISLMGLNLFFFFLGLLFISLSFVLDPSFPSVVKKSLSKLGVPSAILEFLLSWVDAHEECLKIPQAKGAMGAIRSEAFFIPLYELYLTYGGIFRLNFGPKVCLFLFVYIFWNLLHCQVGIVTCLSIVDF